MILFHIPSEQTESQDMAAGVIEPDGSRQEEMMTYRQFREALAEEISRRSGESIEISFRDMQSNNDIHAEGITLGSGYGKFLPSVDMDLLYQEYGKGVSVRHLAKLLIHQYEQVQKKCSIPIDFFANYERISHRVYCKLVSRRRNAELLQEVPYRSWADLAVVVYYRVEPSLVDGGMITIRHEHLRRWGIGGDELFRHAWMNTASAMHPILRPLSTMLGEVDSDTDKFCEEDEDFTGNMLGHSGLVFERGPDGSRNGHVSAGGAPGSPRSIIVNEDSGEYRTEEPEAVMCADGSEEPEAVMCADGPEEPKALRCADGLEESEDSACADCPDEGIYSPLYILTNREKCLGAVSIAIPGEAELIAEQIRSDYYVLPSSIHECLILPDDGSYEEETLNQLVRSVNMTQVDPSEVLSDHVYHYSRSCGGFDI